MPKRALRQTRWVSLLILLAMLVGACAKDTPDPTPLPTPTPAPTPTPTPAIPPLDMADLPLPAPRLLYYSPAVGEEQALDAPVELVFDQPMDPSSVEAALAISPGVEGTWDWSNERVLRFEPAGQWERGQRYSVSLAAEARNQEGTPLEEPVSFLFQAVGFLQVSEVQPAPDSDELDPDTAVTVVFNRPVVPLTAIEQQSALPDPLVFDPPVSGEGEWLNTSIYTFRPEVGFLPATTYEARVQAGLSDTLGGVLEADYAWTFSTVRPAILSVWPWEGFQYVAPTDTVSITFNQPMDHASVEERFTLQASGQPVEGSFRWEGAETIISSETMTFVPAGPLPRGTMFQGNLRAGALPRVGVMALERPKTWTLHTVADPGVVNTYPRDGATGVELYEEVEIYFASPMRQKGFLDHLSITPAVTEVYPYWSESETRLYLSFVKDPATTYEVRLDADTPDKYGATLGREYRFRFTTGDLSAFAALNTGGWMGTFSAYTDTVAYASYRNVTRLDLALYRLDPVTFMELGAFGEWGYRRDFRPGEDDLIQEWSRAVEAPRNQVGLARFELADAQGGALPPGLYYLYLTAPGVDDPSRYIFVLSRLNLALKQSRAELLVWATDLASGQPVADLSVSVYTTTKTVIVDGSTDPAGLFLAEGVHFANLWDPLFVMTGQPGEDGFGVTYNSWSSGIEPWDFDLVTAFWDEPYRGYLYTERPIYRPGQTVYFKGILRDDDDAHYSLPQPGEVVDLRIEDPQGKEVYRKTLPLGDMGTVYDEFLLDEEAPLGYYWLYMGAPGERYGSYASTAFQVAEYKKPEYQVSVTTDRDDYLDGEPIQVTAEASYYFGGPVADAEVHWSVLSGEFFFDYECPQGQGCPWYSWTDREEGVYLEGPYYDEGGYGRLVAEGDTKTDKEGRVTFAVPADISQDRQSRQFTIEASVTDLNGQQVSNRTAAVVHQGAFYVGVAPQGYLAEVDEEKSIDLITVDWDSAPVANVPLTVVFMEHRWYSVREDEGDGYYWTWETEDIPLYTTTVTTGRDGRAVATFVPEQAGTYRVRAIGRDGQGHEIRSSAYFWAWGGGFVSWRRESNNRIELIADKRDYQVGDVAEILIPSPYSGTVQALVTLERGHIVESFVRELPGNSEVLQVPIQEAHVPNIFVSVVIVQGSEQAPDGLASFRMGTINLPVSIETKELQITLTPDRSMERGEHYGPRQTATYDVLVTDAQGNPVQVELSLRLADLAVLALADEFGPTMLEQFWRSRGLGVRTSMPMVVALEQYNRELAPGGKGGGGGEDEGGLIRSEFADTAFWDPAVRTDENGRAQVTVDLPDNLTTWRMQARGISADTRVGRAEVDILSTLDLLVRPVLPRFFVVGDRAELATIVHNNTAASLEAEVHLSASGLDLSGPDLQVVTIAAGDKVKVVWPVTVPAGSEVKVRTWASAGELYDGREDTLPVYRYSTPEVVATAGRLSEPGLRQEIIQLPPVFDPSQGELAVQVDGSLTAATKDALDYLSHYPYECVEQTVSRFLPNLLTYQALVEMGLDRPELRANLEKQVSVALQRLYANQHYDGGWGWWTGDASNPYLTAYVLQGLLEAHRAGFAVEQQVLDNAAHYLRQHLPSASGLRSGWQANRLAYQLYVLAEYGYTFGSRDGGGLLSTAVGLFESRHLLARYGQATLAVALSLLEPEEPSRVQTLLSDLAGDAVLSATGTHWEEDTPDYWNMNTDIRTTAIVIWAMARLEPQSERLPNAVRWLMAVRKEGYWRTTQSTAWSLMGLVQYMRASGELQGDFSYTVYLNGDGLVEGDVSRENIDQSQVLRIEIGRLLVEEGNRLVIRRHEPREGQTGLGQLYYTVQLRYYLPADQVKALDRGIIVDRQYSLVDDPDVPIHEAKVGDLIRVKLTIIAPSDLYYVVVEDPLPAGCEGVDQSLKTTSVVGERPTLRNLTAEEESRWYRWYGWGWWWFSHTEMRDEKVALFATYLPRGTYQYTYLIRAGVPGQFLTMPAVAYEMYFPEVFGRSDGGLFTVNAE